MESSKLSRQIKGRTSFSFDGLFMAPLDKLSKTAKESLFDMTMIDDEIEKGVVAVKRKLFFW